MDKKYLENRKWRPKSNQIIYGGQAQAVSVNAEIEQPNSSTGSSTAASIFAEIVKLPKNVETH